MRQRNARDEQMAALRERLSRLSEASLRINESLELDEVLRGVLDSARSLTDARYALITTMRDTGGVEDFVVSGLTAEEAQRLWEVPEGMQLFSYFNSIPAPLRVQGTQRGDGLGGIEERGKTQWGRGIGRHSVGRKWWAYFDDRQNHLRNLAGRPMSWSLWPDYCGPLNWTRTIGQTSFGSIP